MNAGIYAAWQSVWARPKAKRVSTSKVLLFKNISLLGPVFLFLGGGGGALLSQQTGNYQA